MTIALAEEYLNSAGRGVTNDDGDLVAIVEADEPWSSFLNNIEQQAGRQLKASAKGALRGALREHGFNFTGEPTHGFPEFELRFDAFVRRWMNWIRAEHELGDPGDPSWGDDWPVADPIVPVTAYLGWPAYLLAVVRAEFRCENCDRLLARGGRYCKSRDCERERERDRQAEHRAPRTGQR